MTPAQYKVMLLLQEGKYIWTFQAKGALKAYMSTGHTRKDRLSLRVLFGIDNKGWIKQTGLCTYHISNKGIEAMKNRAN